MDHFQIIDKDGIQHIVSIGWNFLLANDHVGIFVYCHDSNIILGLFYHQLRTFSDALRKTFGNDQLQKVN